MGTEASIDAQAHFSVLEPPSATLVRVSLTTLRNVQARAPALRTETVEVGHGQQAA